MSSAYVKLAVLVAVFLLYVESAKSINCYQCASTDTKKPYLCTEFMTEDEDIQPKPCNETYDAKYCIKFTGRDEDGLQTRRFCSSLDLGTYCIYGNQNGDTLDYRSCFYTCSTDGCNSATKGAPSSLQDLITVALLLSFKIFI